VLVLAIVVAAQTHDGWFETAALSQSFEDLRLPKPANLSAVLGRLRDSHLLVARRVGGTVAWSHTPVGRERAMAVVGDVDLKALAQHAAAPGAEFGHARHILIPPALAPAKWSHAIATLLTRSPFDSNVFCMTRFPDPKDETDPNDAVISAVAAALGDHGLVLHLASDRIVDDDLLGNVAAYMWACRYGIALFEDRVGRGLVHNVVIEVGAMLMAGRRCALLKVHTAPAMPTDLVGQIYKPVDFEDPAAVSREVHLWAGEDLGLGRCSGCPI
jgi:hypothetical protein